MGSLCSKPPKEEYKIECQRCENLMDREEYRMYYGHCKTCRMANAYAERINID